MLQLPTTDQIVSRDHWLRSASDGRYLLLRGVCFGPSAKLPPYLPFRSRADWDKYETYADLMLACGFTTLRIPFLWAAFEPICDPERPVYNEQFFEDFFYFIRKFSDKGFLIVIDLHQDLVGKEFGGGGMPDWVSSEGRSSPVWLRNTPLWGLNYVLNPSLRRTFTDFWSNDLSNSKHDPPLLHFKVRDRFLDAVERIAEASATIERVLGIEIFNEPHPAKLNDRTFEEEILPAFYKDAITRIRKHSQTLYALVSPASDWNANLRTEKSYDSYLHNLGDDQRVIFAYHYYDSIMTGLHGLLFHDSKREEYVDAHRLGVLRGREKGMVPFLTEFGTRQNWMNSIVRRHMNWQYEAVESATVHATYWNINLYNTHETFDGFMKEDFSLLGAYDEHSMPKPRNLDVATRPYVMVASAEPAHMYFNIRTKEFEVILRGKPVDAATVIYVPAVRRHEFQPVHYEKHFDVQYNGTMRAQTFENNLLSLLLDPELEMHEIVIKPKTA